MNTSVHLISLGCARNDVDSEELAARLDQDGFCLVDDPDAAEVIMVNTCGFIEQAKKDSIDTLLAASDHKSSGRAKAVVAVGCMAERYGTELAEALPEADAVLGFDAYPKIAGKLKSLLDGNRLGSHTPVDRRTLLPAAPNARQDLVSAIVPGHSGIANLPTGLAPASGPRVLRRRLHTGPFAPLKIASGCDRRCAFCAIPSFRGSSLSRPIDEIVTEARWLAAQGVREVMLVSENTSSYGKDLGIRHPLPTLLERLSGIEGLEWIRVSYVQPRHADRHHIDREGRALFRHLFPACIPARTTQDETIRRPGIFQQVVGGYPGSRTECRGQIEFHRWLPGGRTGGRGDPRRFHL